MPSSYATGLNRTLDCLYYSYYVLWSNIGLIEPDQLCIGILFIHRDAACLKSVIGHPNIQIMGVQLCMLAMSVALQSQSF